MQEHRGIFHPSYNKRVIFFVITDGFLFLLSILISFSIRLGVMHLGGYINEIILFFTTVALYKFIAMFFCRAYSITWKYFSMKDAVQLVLAIPIPQIIASLILFFGFYKGTYITVPRSLFFLDYFLTLFFIIGFRIIKRAYVLYFKRGGSNANNIIVYGAGDGGEQIIRDMLRENSVLRPVAIIDDDKEKTHSLIHGIVVEGTLDRIEFIASRHNVDTVIIAIPSMGKKRLQEVYDYLQNVNIKKIKILPPADEILNEQITLKSLKNLDIMDLVGRETVDIDVEIIIKYLKNKTILVTGAGGSIGSELVNQIARYEVERIIALDIDETELFYLKNKISEKYNMEIMIHLADIRDEYEIEKLFNTMKIDIVFHAAALKHVPICEDFPLEAVKTNILGTNNLIKHSYSRVERFIFISTDKAVNPSSVMGGTKRVCEYLIKNASGKKTMYSAVRFGNVLGSRGSVIPIFKRQIERGGPLTVTNPEMKRYFMTIPEAVILIIEAGGGSTGGEIFILDMGESVLIREVAEKMINMYGYEVGKDIEIIYTGIRPGEKLVEELLTDEEGIEESRFEKIFKAKSVHNLPSTDELIDSFSNITDNQVVISLLEKYIPTFKNEKK